MTLVKVLGLDHAQAVGLSSYDAGGLYRNCDFIHAEPQGGVLLVVSTEPELFEVAERAPARTDFAWEQSLDPSALVHTFEGSTEFGVGRKPQELATGLDSSLAPLAVTPRALLEGLQTRVAMTLAVDE